jgi:hypothetical protein
MDLLTQTLGPDVNACSADGEIEAASFAWLQWQLERLGELLNPNRAIRVAPGVAHIRKTVPENDKSIKASLVLSERTIAQDHSDHHEND